MVFQKYKLGLWKKEIRILLRKRLDLKDRLRYHQKKIEHHQDKIKIIEDKTLIDVEIQLNEYLERAGNKI